MKHYLYIFTFVGLFFGTAHARTILLDTETGSVTVSGAPFDFGGVLMPDRQQLPDGSLQFTFAGDFILQPGDTLRGIGPVPAVFFVGNNVFIPASAAIDFSGIATEPGAGGAASADGGSGGAPGGGGSPGKGGAGGGFGPGGLIYTPNTPLPIPVSLSLPGVPPASAGNPGTVGRLGGAGLAGGKGSDGQAGFNNPLIARGAGAGGSNRASPLPHFGAVGAAGETAPYQFNINPLEYAPPIFWGNPDLREFFNPGFGEEEAFRTKFYSGRPGGAGMKPPAQPGSSAPDAPAGAFGNHGLGGSNLGPTFALAGGSSGGGGSGGAGGPGGTGGPGGGGGGGGQGEFAEPLPTSAVDFIAAVDDYLIAQLIEQLVNAYLDKKGYDAVLNIFNIPTLDIGASGGRGGRGGDGARGTSGGHGGDGGPGGAGGGALLIHAKGRIVFLGDAEAEGGNGLTGLSGAPGGQGPFSGSSGSPGRAPLPGFGMSTILSPWSTFVNLMLGPSAGNGAQGGQGGGGGNGGTGFPGGSGGGGAGGTLIFKATDITGSGKIFLRGGNQDQGGREGGAGRFFLASNLMDEGIPLDAALSAIGIVVHGNTDSETARGPSASNPFIAGSPETPLLPDLVDGAEAFGLLTEDAINIILSDGSGNLLSATPGEAVIAAARFDVGPAPFDWDFPGYDLVLVFNTRTNLLTDVSFGANFQALDPATGEAIPDPATAEFSDGLAPFHSEFATYGGYARDTRFGGSGHDSSAELESLKVFAFLVPEDTDELGMNFVLAATNDGNDFRLEVDRLANGDIISATFNPDIDVYEAEWTGPASGGPDGNWNHHNNWSTRLNGIEEFGLIPNNTTARAYNVGIFLGSAHVLQDTKITIDRLGIGAPNGLTTDNGQDLIIEKFNVRPSAGVIDNAGTIFLNSTGDATSLRFSGSRLTLTGTGLLETTLHAENRIAGIRSTDSLIQEAGHRIRASGVLGANLLRIENRGLIEGHASSSPFGADYQTLTINPAGSAADLAPGFVNAPGAILRPGSRYSQLRLQDGFFLFEELPSFHEVGGPQQLITFRDARFNGAGNTWEIQSSDHSLLVTGQVRMENLTLAPSKHGAVFFLDAFANASATTFILPPLEFDDPLDPLPPENWANRILTIPGRDEEMLLGPVHLRNSAIRGGRFSFIDPGNLPSFGTIDPEYIYDEVNVRFQIYLDGSFSSLENVRIDGNYRFDRELQMNAEYVFNHAIPEAMYALEYLIDPQDMVRVQALANTLVLAGMIENDGLIRAFSNRIEIPERLVLTGKGGMLGLFGMSSQPTLVTIPDGGDPARFTIDTDQSVDGFALDTANVFIENRGSLTSASLESGIDVDRNTVTTAELAGLLEKQIARNTGMIEPRNSFGGGTIDNRGGRIILGEYISTLQHLRILGGEIALHGLKTEWSRSDFDAMAIKTFPFEVYNLDLEGVTITSPAFDNTMDLDSVLDELTIDPGFGSYGGYSSFGILNFQTSFNFQHSFHASSRPVRIKDNTFATTAAFDRVRMDGTNTLAPGVHFVAGELLVGDGANFVQGAGPNPEGIVSGIVAWYGISAAEPDPVNPPRFVFEPGYVYRISGEAGRNEVTFEIQPGASVGIDTSYPFSGVVHDLIINPAGGPDSPPGFINRGILDLSLIEEIDHVTFESGHYDNRDGEIVLGDFESQFSKVTIRDAVIEGGVIRNPIQQNIAISLENVTLRNVRLIDVGLYGTYTLEDCILELSGGDQYVEISGNVEVIGDLSFRDGSGSGVEFDLNNLPNVRDPLRDRILIEEGVRILGSPNGSGNVVTSLTNHGVIEFDHTMIFTTPLIETGETLNLDVQVPAPNAPIGEVVTLADLGLTEALALSGSSRIVNAGFIDGHLNGILEGKIIIREAAFDNSGGRIEAHFVSVEDSLVNNTDGRLFANFDLTLYNAIIFGGEIGGDTIFIEGGTEEGTDFGRESITTLQDVAFTGIQEEFHFVFVESTLFTSGLIDGSLSWFENQGEVIVAGSASLFRVAEFSNGGTLRLAGGTLEIMSGGSYWDSPRAITVGSGTISSESPVELVGLLSPGAEFALGTLTFTGDLLLEPTITYRAKLGAEGASDLVIAGGDSPLILQGTLELSLFEGYNPSPGDTFTIIESSQPIAGSFGSRGDGDRINIPGTGSFRLNYVQTGPDAYAATLDHFLPQVFPEVHHLDGSAAGAADGTSWFDAFTSLYAALEAAQPGDDIWAAAGVYSPRDSDGGTSFFLGNGVTLSGGFNGTETEREQRDPSIHISEFGLAGTEQFHAWPTFISQGNTAHTVLDGIRVASSAPGLIGASALHRLQRGGGIYILEGSEVRILDCEFFDNRASNAGTAIRIEDSSPEFVNLHFADNAGIALYVENASVVLTGASFEENGTGVSFVNASGVISDALFDGQTSASLLVTGDAEVSVLRSRFLKNSLTQMHAVRILGASDNAGDPLLPTVTFDRCEFWGNGRADFPIQGEALFNQGILTLSNSLVAGNSASYGGGVFQESFSIESPDPQLTAVNTTFAGNKATVAGGAISGGKIHLINSIVWGNAANGATGTPLASIHVDPGNLTTSHSLIEAFAPGGTGDLDGTIVTNAPRFRAPVHPLSAPTREGDYRLNRGSPVRDAGSNADVAGGLDLDGNPRISGTAVNLGAYESQFVLYVDSGGKSNGGLSWEDAYTDLQTALAAAEPGDEIRVSAGTYTPTSGSDRNATFAIPSGVHLRGGFPAGGDTGGDPDPAANPTILSGELGDPLTFADNSRHVLTGDALDADTVIDGFIITRGNANGTEAGHGNKGGGMLLINGSNPTLSRLTFIDNRATGLPGAATINDSRGWGGALAVIGSGPALVDCHFEANRALGTHLPSNVSGGQARGGAAAFIDSHVNLLRVTFRDNEVIGGGGAAGANGTASSRNGQAGRHGGDALGGAFYGTNSNGTLRESVFRENRARAGAGGRGGNGAVGANSSTTGGTGGPGGAGGNGGAGGTSHGGGMYFESATINVINTRFEGNFTYSPQNGAGGHGAQGGKGGTGSEGADGTFWDDDGKDGGKGGTGGTGGGGGHAGASGRSFGGGIYGWNAQLDLFNAIFVANHAIAVPNVGTNNTGGSGGAGGAGGNGGAGGIGYHLWSSNGATGATGNTGSGGTPGTAAPPSREEGGAISGTTAHSNVTNVTFVENRALDLYATTRGQATVNNTILYRNYIGAGTLDSFPSGSITYGGSFVNTVDPLFVRNPDPGDSGDWENTADNDYGDLRLLVGSPALNNGDNALNGEPSDLAGGDRIIDGTIDTGAYEGDFTFFDSPHLFGALAPDADSNESGLSNFIEYAIGNDPLAPGGHRHEGSFDGEFYTYPLRPRGIDFELIHEMSTDLITFTPMIEGLHYERLGNGQIRILLQEDILFLRHAIRPLTPNP